MGRCGGGGGGGQFGDINAYAPDTIAVLILHAFGASKLSLRSYLDDNRKHRCRQRVNRHPRQQNSISRLPGSVTLVQPVRRAFIRLDTHAKRKPPQKTQHSPPRKSKPQMTKKRTRYCLYDTHKNDSTSNRAPLVPAGCLFMEQIQHTVQ